jgi:hypothetical protein
MSYPHPMDDRTGFDATDAEMGLGKTPGQIAYEEDCRRHPRYHTGELRRTWDALSNVIQHSWERQPTPRDYQHHITHGSASREH